MATEPPRACHECAKALGISLGTVQSQWSKLRAKLDWDPLQAYKEGGRMPGGNNTADEDVIALRNVSPDTVVKLNEMSQERLLRRLYKNFEDVPPEKIPAMIRDLTNARALVKGEPTQILRVDQRATLKKLIPAMLKEAEKRGISLQLDGEGAKLVKQVRGIDTERVDAAS